MDEDAVPTRTVDLVRLPKEERYFDRDEVLGRDATSVFPTESKAGLDTNAVKELLGSNTRFISETELEDIKSKRGARVEDGSLAPDKPLAQVLAEAKEAKEAAFAETWKQMKTGKNRPLDEEEAVFLGAVAAAEAAAQRSVAEQEAEELAAFQEAVQRQREARVAGPAAGPPSSTQQANHRPARKQPLVSVRPVARPVAVAAKRQGAPGGGQAAAQAEQPEAKRPRGGSAEAGVPDAEPGLAGLLGQYSSDSDA